MTRSHWFTVALQAALFSAALFSTALSSTVAVAAPLAHMVFFELAEDTPQQRAELVKLCEQHLANHEGEVSFSVGVIAEEMDRPVNDQQFDVAVHLVFADLAAHDRYQTHPRHLAFIDAVKPMLAGVRVFDSYLKSWAPKDPATTKPLP